MQSQMQNDWYLTNKTRWGSAQWLVTRFWPLPILGGIVLPAIILSLIGNLNDNALLSTVYLFALLLELALTLLPAAGIAWIVAVKLDDFHDELFVLDELAKLKWLAVVSLVGVGLLVFS